MKKLLLILGAISVTSTVVIPVVSCTYIDTVKKSVQNKVKELTNSTSHYFKGAILASSEDYNGQEVDKYINSLKIGDLNNNPDDQDTTKSVFGSYFDLNQSDGFMKNHVYTKDEFNKPKQTNEIEEQFNSFQKLFNEIYRLIGVKLDPYLISPLIIDIMKQLKWEDFKFTKTLHDSGISDKLAIFKQVNVPGFKDLQKMGVKNNQQLKFYTLGQMTLLFDNLFGNGNAKEFNIIENSENISQAYYEYNTDIFKSFTSKQPTKIASEKSQKTLSYLFNVLFGINWYTKNFLNNEYDLQAKDMLDDNHVFSKTKTNLEVFAEIDSQPLDRNIIDGLSINGLLLFIRDIFSGEQDEHYFKLNRFFKILFQVDDDITDNNPNLNFDQKVIKIGPKTIMGLQVGEWKSNGKTTNGLLNPFLSSSVSGVVSGLIEQYDNDGGIREFLNFLGVGNEAIGGIVSGLFASSLSGINMRPFYETMTEQLTESLQNLKEWSIIGMSEKIQTILERVLTTIESYEPFLKKINQLQITNKLFGQILTTPIRKIISLLGIENALPIELPNISLKEIIDLPILFGYKLSDLLRVSTEIGGMLFALIAKGLIPKLTRILDTLTDASWVESDEIKIYDGFGGEVTDKLKFFSDDIKNQIAWKNQSGDKELISNVAFAKRFTETYEGGGWSIVVPESFGLNNQKLRGQELTRYILGIGVLEGVGAGATINNSKFRPKTFLGELSSLWENETGRIIQGFFEAMKQALEWISAQFDQSKKVDYKQALNYSRYSTKIISYTNFSDETKESNLTYHITYSSGAINNTYEVKLRLPIKKASETIVKYELIGFDKI